MAAEDEENFTISCEPVSAETIRLVAAATSGGGATEHVVRFEDEPVMAEGSNEWYRLELEKAQGEIGRLHARIKSLEGCGEDLLRRAERAETTIEKLSARHQPTAAKNLIRCDHHVNMRHVPWEQLRDCPDCRNEPITVCSNLTCCEWPCADRIALDEATGTPPEG